MTAVTIRLLGTFQVLHDGAPVTRFGGEKVRALLAYLAAEAERPHARTSLAALLWPELPDELALRNLSQAVVRLRAALGEEGTLLRVTRQELQWHSAASDAATFVRLVRSAEVADLARAAELYGGEFLAGFSLSGCEAFEEWQLLRREQLRQLALSTLARLAETHERAGDYAALCAYARQQIALEPWEEAAHRQLMRGLALSGDRSAALTQYERCREVLANELGVEPDVETRALYEQIRADHLTRATRNVAAPRHNLPAPLTPFVGREEELAELTVLRAQPDTRLLTLIGAGGMGKTRLALELARASLDAYADGVFFVGLASLATASELPSAVAQALDLALHGDPAKALLRFLRTKQLLLILDNFEHLLDGAELVLALLQEAPQLQIIATSRARLNVRGEQIYLVQGLHYAGEARQGAAANSAAVRLFAQAGRRSQPGFQVGEANLPAVLRICRLVHGMPLGLELAAAWIEMLSLDEIASEIEASADFLSADWLDAPARQRSMRAVFDWSWRLLSEGEQQVLRQLSVFRGGFRREAAEQVAGASLRVLTTLVHKSLLRRADGSATSMGRYELHELLRQFAAEQLDALPDERATVEARHSAFYLQFVAERERRLARNQPHEAAAEIQSELDNVRQAWAWAVEHAQVAALEASAYGVWQFYTWIGLVSEGAQMLHVAAEYVRTRLEQANQSDRTQWLQDGQRLLSKLLAMQAYLLISRINHPQALSLAQQAIALGQLSGGVEGETIGYLAWGFVLSRASQYLGARSRLEHSVQLARRYQRSPASLESLHDAEWLAYLLLRGVYRALGDYSGAIDQMTQGLQICQALGKLRGEITCLINLAAAYKEVNDYGAARQHAEQALGIARRLSFRWGEGLTQLELADIVRLQGEYARAEALAERALALFREFGDRALEAYAVICLGRLYCSLGNYARAQAWFDEALRVIGLIEPPQVEVEMEAVLPLALLCHHTAHDRQALRYAERGWQIAQEHLGPHSQAYASIVTGHVLAGLDRLAEAAAAYQRALAFYAELGSAPLAATPRSGLAQIALIQGDLTQAQAHVEALLPVLADQPQAGLDQPFEIYLTCYRVLEAIHDPRAAAVLQAGQRLLQEYAESIPDPTLRRSFLENVPTHRELLQVDTSVAAIAER